MLIAALGLTILGFAFLVASVATGVIGWAWACIVVGALGLSLLLVDVIRGRGTDDTDTVGASVDASGGSDRPA